MSKQSIFSCQQLPTEGDEKVQLRLTKLTQSKNKKMTDGALTGGSPSFLNQYATCLCQQ